MSRHGGTKHLVTIDGVEYSMAELSAATGICVLRLRNWRTRGYFAAMLPAIKLEIKRRKNGRNDLSKK